MRDRIKKFILVYFFFIIFSSIVIFVYYTVKEFEYQNIVKNSKEESFKRSRAIEEHIRENLSVLKLLQAYVQKNQSIRRDEFSYIVNPIIESNQSIQALEWIPKVSFNERAFFESRAIKDGLKNLFIKEYDSNGLIIKAKPRDYYYPIYYLEPLESNEIVLGFDISTHSLTKGKLYLAIDEYGFAYSSGLKLIQDSLDYGLVTYLPVYKRSQKGLKPDKKEIVGFVAGVYRTSRLLNYALSEFTDDYSIQVYDNTDSSKRKIIYSLTPSKFDSIPKSNYLGSWSKSKILLNSYNINLANFSWELVFISNPQKEFWTLSIIILVIGGLLVFFFSVIFYLNKKKSMSLFFINQQLMQELRTRRKYEKKLKLSEERFSKLFISSPIPITYIRLFDRTLVDINTAFESTFGYKKHKIIGKTTFEIGMWLNSDLWNYYYIIYNQHGEIKDHEAEVITINGEVKTCLISGCLIRLQDQDYIYTFFQDITERKRFEVALHDSEIKYREVFNTMNDAFFVYDLDEGVLVDSNLKASQLYRYSKDEFKGMNLVELSSNEQFYTYIELKDWYVNSLEKDKSGIIEWKAKDKYGRIFWVEISFKVVIIENRKYVLSVSRDISERKEMEKLLIENELLFRLQFNNSNLGIAITSTDNLFIRVNKKYCDILGYTEEELQGRSWIDFTYHDDLEVEVTLFNQMVSGESEGYEKNKRYNKKDGGLAYVHISVSCFRNPDKSIYYIIAYVFDITDRLEMDNKILKTIIETEESERTRFAQELHDGLGPLLSSIKMYTQWMLKPGANLDQNDALLQIEYLVNIANQTVREIAFGLSPHILKDFGLIEALESFIEKLKVNKSLPVEIKSNLTRRLDETTETIIYRILIECINNSFKHSQADLIKIEVNESSNYLDIDYQDNGIGFDLNEVAEKKSGMGIYNIQNRLKSINGKLLIFSQHGKGTQIKINIIL